MFARGWRLVGLLYEHKYGLTLDELASELSVTTRTIRRELDALQEAYLPLVREPGDGKLPPKWGLSTQRCPVCQRSSEKRIQA